MPITLPEALLLFALHDDRGTVHSAAYLALDPGLRGAVLSELKLRGYVQVRTTGDIRFHPAPPAPPTIPFLREALDAVARCASPAPVGVWVDALAAAQPDQRTRVRTA
ncbi:MAG: GPP34 family phosphoprotein, partial [Myxococcota bacterium]